MQQGTGARQRIDSLGSVGRRNNFDLLRLLAASAVLVSHSYALTGRPEPHVGRQSLGELGVAVFFSISGFLITQSFVRDSNLVRYVLKRALRIVPGLLLVVLLIALVLGPIVSTVSPPTYFRSTELYRFIGQSSVLYTFSGGRLPGVFGHNPYPSSVDGSLWTLPVEVMAYAGVALLGTVGGLRGMRGIGLASLGVLVVLLSPLVNTDGLHGPGPLNPVLPEALYLWALFNTGLVLYGFRDRVRLRWELFAVLGIAWLILGQTSLWKLGSLAFLPYATLVLAFRTPERLRVLTAPGDVSYGVYIYAFPVQQTLAQIYGGHLAPIPMAMLAFPFAYVLALGSWRLVERRALALKPKPGGGRRAALV